MNLYIINEVLYDLGEYTYSDTSDYTPGMVVIAAENIDCAREIFVNYGEFDASFTVARGHEFNNAIAEGHYKTIEGVNHPEGVVSYVCG